MNPYQNTKKNLPRHQRFVLLFLLGYALIRPGTILGQDRADEGFKPAMPGRAFAFPADHRAHRDYKTEWWYYNGQLQDTAGHRYGYQLTFFRVGIRPGPVSSQGSRWRVREVYLAHLAVTDVAHKSFSYAEKVSRGNLGLAGAETGRYRVWIEDWSVGQEGEAQVLRAGDRSLGLNLQAFPTHPPLIHGSDGISRKGAGTGQASHYYSLTRMATRGQMFLKGRTVEVQGLSWMDHEFGSNQLQTGQIGWDWFSLNLGDQAELMLYQIRERNGQSGPYSSGTMVSGDRIPQPLSREDFSIEVLRTWKSPRSQATYPAGWQINSPRQKLFLRITPVLADQELMTMKSTRVTYWEGLVTAEGTYQGQSVKGQGYVEMTGYDLRFAPRL
jgi:predicted secreted hydrolase